MAHLEIRFFVDISRLPKLFTGKSFDHTCRAKVVQFIKFCRTISSNRPPAPMAHLEGLLCKSISVTCLLVTILFGNVEQKLITLSYSIEKYQEIGPWILWLAW